MIYFLLRQVFETAPAFSLAANKRWLSIVGDHQKI